MKLLIVLLMILKGAVVFGQQYSSLDSFQPDTVFENIHVKKIASDSIQSCFIIWIKKGVKGHFHQSHTENIIVIDGKAIMTLDDKTINIKKGDYINVPKGTKHAVLEITSKKPLKVLSIQSPYFDGSDRVFVTKAP